MRKATFMELCAELAPDLQCKDSRLRAAFPAEHSLYKKKMGNQTTMIEFLLLGFSDVRELQILHFAVFLVIYLAALLGNFVIITVIAVDQHLHTPMYFFLGNLSFIDLLYISVTVPKSMVNSLCNTRVISLPECAGQLFSFVSLIATELIFLTIMAFDRYVAICKPLHYTITVNKNLCLKLACGSWVGCGLYSALHTVSTFSLPFCGSVINQFFCDIPPLLNLRCSKDNISETVMIAIGLCLCFSCFALIAVSYVKIFSAILKIPSIQGRHKVFSTCLPHLMVVTLFLSTSIFVYIVPTSNSPSKQNLVVAVFYTVLPPLINPFIYSLRNQEIKKALGKLIGRNFHPNNKMFIPEEELCKPLEPSQSRIVCM
ncbi:olfactory receptor 14A16-like [Trachemys scripta elegans]|uniref:olfactory receptor 14A16-like n=1 Tax=Trachemys scripta elegans TaxID=31138 RepID=UPI0015566153|nr:olfactory receptor 14A16-like [Trachemys scripta elegans]